MTKKSTNITNIRNNKWINADVQAQIKPPPTPLIKVTNGNTEETNINKIKMCIYPASATSETYELKAQTFKNGKPEEFLQMTKEFKTDVDGTGTTFVTGKIQFLRTMLRGEALREFDVITGQVGSTNNTHLKTKECLFSSFFPSTR